MSIAAVLAGLMLAAASGAVAEPSVAAGASEAGTAATPSKAERRCRSLARRRLARVAAVAAGPARRAARARVKRKLRRCLRQARRRAAKGPAGTPGGGATPGPGAGGGPGGTPPPTLGRFLGVTASDSGGFRLTLSRPVVAAGEVTVELRNTDAGPHDLVVRPEAGGDEVGRLDPVEPGATAKRKVTLAKGRWYLFCSLPGHEAAGMHATVRAE